MTADTTGEIDTPPTETACRSGGGGGGGPPRGGRAPPVTGAGGRGGGKRRHGRGRLAIPLRRPAA